MKTKKEIAMLLKVTPRTVTNLEKRGLLPPSAKRGNHKQSRSFYPDDAIDYLKQSLVLRCDNKAKKAPQNLEELNLEEFTKIFRERLRMVLLGDTLQ